jgi:PI4-kinase N-terminal region
MAVTGKQIYCFLPITYDHSHLFGLCLDYVCTSSWGSFYVQKSKAFKKSLISYCRTVGNDSLIKIQEERVSDIGQEADEREAVLSCHTCFLIKNMAQRDEHVRNISVDLLFQLKEKFPQVSFTAEFLPLFRSGWLEFPYRCFSSKT